MTHVVDDLEKIIASEGYATLTVEYSRLPWLFHPLQNIKANVYRVLGRNIGEGWVKFKDKKMIFDGVIKHRGRRVGWTGASHFDRELPYSRITHIVGHKSLDPFCEWVRDSFEELKRNGDDMWQSMRRKVMLAIHDYTSGGRRTYHQHDVSWFQSWYALPISLPVYLVKAGWNYLFKSKEQREEKKQQSLARGEARPSTGIGELVEMGEYGELENTPLPGDIKWDENLIYRIGTAFLGKMYEIRDTVGNTFATTRRKPLTRLLTAFLKDTYEVTLYNPKILKTTLAMTDYAQHKLELLLSKLESPMNVGDALTYST